ncbi:MAG: DUF6886 family protein [Pseudomonadales bacterium]
MPGRLFHFSDDDGIERFEPRPVRTPSPRPPGRDWLNGPLVWAIDEWHQPLYLFPRECPRILIWRRPSSEAADVARYFAGSTARMVAWVEEGWRNRLESAHLQRYELPDDTFESLDDAGMWVSRAAVLPRACERIDRLPDALARADVELRLLPSLKPLNRLWETSLHASGIRLRNARDW